MSNIINESERSYLLSSMEELLIEYNYNYTKEALHSIIDEWAIQKKTLIEAFKRHPNYVEGKFMIAFTSDYERALNPQGARNFSSYLRSSDGPIFEMLSSLPEEVNKKRIDDNCRWLPNDLWYFFERLDRYVCHTLNEETATEINNMLPNIKARERQKMSRVINKIMVYLGYDKHPDYNREFAKFADSLNPLTIKRHTVISINPLDYLTMSFGNSWASCHTIDKENKRRMPNNYSGCYSSGTISYMLDPSSMVLYTSDSTYDGTDYWQQPKINRQMFHWGENKLVQGRLYPQDNDGSADAYTPYRNIVQEVLSTCFEFTNLWTLTKGTSAAREYIDSYGTHYRDYESFSNCTLSRIKDDTNENHFVVGASPICVECGCHHKVEENINCCQADTYRCEGCGCRIDEDDAIYVNDEIYCRNCVSYCDHCGEYHRGDSTYLDRYDRDVCEWCLREYYVMCYDCEEYVLSDNAIYDEESGEWYCNDCYAERKEEE